MSARRRQLFRPAGLLAAAAMAATVFGPTGAAAQDWPGNKTVKIIVPASPGGMVDIPSRVAADVLGKATGGTFILEHRAGAGGTIGTQALMSEDADGSAFLLISSAATIAPVLYPQAVGDPTEDLVPISLVAEIPVAISVPVDSDLTSLEDLAEKAKADPTLFAFGSGGIGSGNHLTAERLIREMGFEMTHIPYGGVSKANTGMLSGEVDMTFTSLTAARALAAGGQGRILAIASAERIPDLPDIPTVAETVPGFTSVNWFGFVGAKGFPTEVRDQIQEALAASLTDGDVAEFGKKAGIDLLFSGPEPLEAHIEEDLPRFRALLDELGIGALQ